jgi:hypothetical protein
MKTKNVLLLSALAFFYSTGLSAQVTIGSSANPKDGAILDLNSGVKGGLVLSNVPLVQLDEIPASFPGTSGVDITSLKNGLKGAMIYNTNASICTGVHVWDGDCWARLTTPVPTEGTLSINSASANLLGGEAVHFTASFPGAKTFRWYMSRNNGVSWKFLAVTTDPFYSGIFSPGINKVKVIADDCRSMLESNEVTFSPESLSPTFGSMAGGNMVYVYGDFQYVDTDEYNQDGLVVHFDAIDNIGKGDKYHSYDTVQWKDLKGNLTLELTQPSLQDNWNSNAFEIKGIQYWKTSNLNTNIPIGNSPRTMEFIFTTPKDGVITNKWIPLCGFEPAAFLSGNAFHMARQASMHVSPLNAHNGGLMFPHNEAQQLGLNDANSLHTFVITYANRISDAQNTNAYVDGTKAEDITRSYSKVDVINTCNNSYSACSLTIGGGNGEVSFNDVAAGYKISSYRLYDRVLTEEEIKANAVLDKKRYLAPPTVSIDGKNCSEVVVLSPHILMCRVPVGSAIGLKDVTVATTDGTVTYNDAYKYVDSQNDFYVSSFLPIIGSGGETLRLKGNRLTDISEIRVGDKECENLVTSPTECTCVLPFNSPGERDITITTDSEIYRFAKVFEYDQ